MRVNNTKSEPLIDSLKTMHDIKLVADTLDALQTDRPGQKLRLCLDKDYEAMLHLASCLWPYRLEQSPIEIGSYLRY